MAFLIFIFCLAINVQIVITVNVHKHCGGHLIPMEKFSFKSNGNEKQEHIEMLKAKGQNDNGLVSHIFIGYLDNKCVALKLTKKEAEEKMPAENSIKTINAIQKFFSKTPQKKPQRIIDVYYLGETEEHYVTVMELAKGSHRKLYKAIDFSDEKPLDQLIQKFALALEELHKAGVIHLDVKRDNFVSTDSGDGPNGDIQKIPNGDIQKIPNGDIQKIIDFDTSRVLDQALHRRKLATLMNTRIPPMWPDRWGIFHGPEFMNENKAMVSTKTDIWALGMIGFELVLYQPKYKLAEKLLYAELRKIADIFRRFTWVDTKEKNPYKLRNSGEWKKVPSKLIFDGEWLNNYGQALKYMLEVRRDLPKIYLLLQSILDISQKNRMTATGVIEFLANKCKPLSVVHLNLSQNELPPIFTGMREHYLAKILTDSEHSDLLEILEHGNAKQKETIAQIQNKAEICNH